MRVVNVAIVVVVVLVNGWKITYIQMYKNNILAAIYLFIILYIYIYRCIIFCNIITITSDCCCRGSPKLILDVDADVDADGNADSDADGNS